MQPIGQIPKDAIVTLTLDPEQEMLFITHKTISISLPFSRINNFECKLVYVDKTNNVLKGAQGFLQNAEAAPTGFDPIGAKKIIAGLAGNIASNLIPSNLVVYTVGTLFYTDKNGVGQYLQFATSRETGNIIKTDENIRMYKDQSAYNFSAKVAIIKSQQAEAVTEL